MAITIVQQPNDLNFSRNTVVYRVATSLGNRSIRARVLVDGGYLGYIQIYQEQKLAKPGSPVLFEFSEVLRAYLNYDVPTLDMTTPVNCSNVCKKFRVDFAEVADDSEVYFTTLYYNKPSGVATISDLPLTIPAADYVFKSSKGGNTSWQLRNSAVPGTFYTPLSGSDNYRTYTDGYESIFTLPDDCDEYRLTIGVFSVDIYTNPLTWSTGSEKYVLLGGFDHYAFPERTANQLPGNNRLMTTRPQTRKMHKSQPEFVYYFPNATSSVTLETILTKPDNTNVTLTDTFTATQYVPVCLNFSYDYLRSRMGTPADFVKAELKISGGATLAKYRIIAALQPWSRVFYYANSLGGFDSLATIAKQQKQTARDSMSFDNYLDPNYAATLEVSGVRNVRFKRTHKQQTGFLNAAEFEAALDILMSERVLLYEDGLLKPVKIDMSDFAEVPDGVYLKSFEFDYQYTRDVIAIKPQ